MSCDPTRALPIRPCEPCGKPEFCQVPIPCAPMPAIANALRPLGFLHVWEDGEKPGVIPLVKGLNRVHSEGTLWLELWVSCVLAMSAVPRARGLRLGSLPLPGPQRVHPGDVLSWVDHRGVLIQAALISIDIETRDRILAELGPEAGVGERGRICGRLTVYNGADKGQIRELREGYQTVGSSPLSTHRIAGLSPFHVVLRADTTHAVLTALAPGVLVNGTACVREELVDGDRLDLGGMVPSPARLPQARGVSSPSRASDTICLGYKSLY